MESRSFSSYVKLQIGSIAIIGLIGVDLASVNELFGDFFVDAKINKYHEF